MEDDDTYKQDLSTFTTASSMPSRADLAVIFNEVATPRLMLRHLRVGDGPAMFAVHGDPATNLYNPAGPHSDLAISEEMLQECLQDWWDADQEIRKVIEYQRGRGKAG